MALRWLILGAVCLGLQQDLRKDLEEAVRKGEMERAASLVEEIAARGDQEAMETLLTVAVSVSNPEIYEIVQKTFRTVERPEALDYLLRCLTRRPRPRARHDRWEIRVALSEAFGWRKDEATFPPLLGALEDSAMPVRLQALKSLARRGERKAVPPIIDLLEEEERTPGILWEEAIQSLRTLTGQDLEAAADWRNWWDAHGDEAPPPPKERRKGADRADPESTRAPEFFGVKIRSGRIVFLIDVSGSMQLWDPGGDTEEERKTGREERELPYRPERQRIIRAKQELNQVLESLKPGVKFNIIAFSHELSCFHEDGLVSASDRNKKAAKAFVDGFRADGGTATDEALEAAFGISGADTVILLADGVVDKPGGDNPSSEEILERVRELNRFRKVRIHSFGFDGDGRRPPTMPERPRLSPRILREFREMMQRLAEENDGKYTSIR